MESRFSVAPELGAPNTDEKVVLFVGPPGAGKTTTLVKLAVAYGIARKIPVQLLSTDILRLGGAEQLQAYARILGAGFQALSGRRSLEQVMDECPSKRLVLIDSPGFGPGDMEESSELSAFIGRHANVEVHLVFARPRCMRRP